MNITVAIFMKLYRQGSLNPIEMFRINEKRPNYAD